MATITYKLSKRVDTVGDSEILLFVTVTRTNRPQIKSGIMINPAWYDAKEGIIIPKRGKLNFADVQNATEQKQRLTDITSRVIRIVNELQLAGKDINRKTITEAMTLTINTAATEITADTIEQKRSEAKKMQFFKAAEKYLKRTDLAVQRIKNIKSMFKCLQRYEHFRRLTGNADFSLDLDGIDKDTLDDIADYIRNEKRLSEEYTEVFNAIRERVQCRDIQQRGENYITERMEMLHFFVNWCNKQGYTDNRPFLGYTSEKKVYGTPYYLTLEERNTVAEYDLSQYPDLAIQRDIFIFHCLIGCRYGDLANLTPANIVTDANGNMAVEYMPAKTIKERARVVSVPLTRRAKEIVKRYKGKRSRGRLFPIASYNKYNDAIKAILKECGITRMVTIRNSKSGKPEQRQISDVASSHMARRTFIGNLYSKVKDPNLIGKLSGHVEGSKAFVRYRDIDAETMRETVNLIE